VIHQPDKFMGLNDPCSNQSLLASCGTEPLYKEYNTT